MSTCRCGEHTDGFPTLIAKDIPHQIRHASIFGALDSLTAGAGLIVVAPHEPLPLLTQVNKRYGNAFQIDYLQEGPEDWHVQFLRVG
jgi:uncharacterized protein (DUF2249 family)